MNKKLLVGVLAAGLLMTGCGQKTDVVLKDEVSHSWVIHGNNQIVVNGKLVNNGWGDKSSELYEQSAMKASSLDEIYTISENFKTSLKRKEVKYAYVGEVALGTIDAGWSTNAMKDGEVVQVNGSFALKAAKASYVEEDKVYASSQWIPNAHDAYAETLTPDTLFMPNWSEEKDENGFNWEANPTCIGEKGIYTLVVVEYAKFASGEPQYGMGLVWNREA